MRATISVSALVFVALAGGACGRVELLSGAAPVQPPQVDASTTDVAAPAWPLVLRLVNVGRSDVVLPRQLVSVCGYELDVRRVDDMTWRQTSLTALDYWCACSSCVGGRLRCESVDLICDDRLLFLAAGQHVDWPWDGFLWTKVPIPAASGCVGECDELQPVKPGRYVFRLSLGPSPSEVETSLPVAGGVLELPLNDRR